MKIILAGLENHRKSLNSGLDYVSLLLLGRWDVNNSWTHYCRLQLISYSGLGPKGGNHWYQWTYYTPKSPNECYWGYPQQTIFMKLH